MPYYYKNGDLVLAAQLNQIVDMINAVEDGFSDSSFIIATRDADIAGTFFFGIHSKRWLVYRSAGTIYNVDNPADTVTLSDCGAVACSYDLHTIPWLNYGMIYKVEGCEFVMEMDSHA